MIPPRSILAAVDFSKSSQVALEFAARLGNQCGAALHVLHVEDPCSRPPRANKDSISVARREKSWPRSPDDRSSLDADAPSRDQR